MLAIHHQSIMTLRELLFYEYYYVVFEARFDELFAQEWR